MIRESMPSGKAGWVGIGFLKKRRWRFIVTVIAHYD